MMIKLSNFYYYSYTFLFIILIESFFLNSSFLSAEINSDSLQNLNILEKRELEDQAFSLPTKLPRILLIGDSISIQYSKEVRNFLIGKASVYWNQENATDTRNGLRKISKYIGSEHWDVIHFNWGLHDLRCIDKIRNNSCLHNVPLKEYKDNLSKIVANLKKTGAKLIFATTTPFKVGVHPPRLPQDVKKYNSCAIEVMRSNGVTVNDLFTFTKHKLNSLQKTNNVHFHATGSKILGKKVADVIEKVIENDIAGKFFIY